MINQCSAFGKPPSGSRRSRPPSADALNEELMNYADAAESRLLCTPSGG